MHDLRRALGEAVAGCAAEVRVDEPLAQHTTFRIGGPADAWVRANDRQALVRVLQFCRASGVRWWLLGRGSNVLVSDQGLRGIVIVLGGELAAVGVQESRDGGQGTGDGGRGARLVCAAGAPLDAVATFAEKNGLAGVEFLAGIPGTIGGGLHSNAGAFGRSLGDVITSVTVVDPDGNERELTGTELRREYRQPMIEEGLVAVDVTLQLHPGEPEPAARIREQRWAKHPKETSAGSFFRNPETGDGGRGKSDFRFQIADFRLQSVTETGVGGRMPAGKLIDQCGLKGKAIGGVKVSEKHANFLVNAGGARFADVYELAQVVKAHVEEETGILLEEEVQYLPGQDEVRSQKAAVEKRMAVSGERLADGGCRASAPEARRR
jgi:UDP-N-acetylmuramate dehydrogenase